MDTRPCDWDHPLFLLVQALPLNAASPPLPIQPPLPCPALSAACGLGLADGIVDLVETGTTMRAAGLEEVSTIMDTQAVLIVNPHSLDHELLTVATRRIEGYLTANRYVMVTYNVHRSSLRSACAITPGKRSPTITSLDEVNWVSVSSLVEKKKAASVMDDLQKIGAKDILTKGLLCYRTDGYCDE
mmetsp:Transcript_51649/g.70386  ORF Transcript_51649/g.70386 Transcript_51649/m.70386 type:complete len:186 (-) Transcript_51649:469-1026(-)